MSDRSKAVVPLGAALVFVVVILVWAAIIAQAQECTEAGGAYVRGVVWFQCVGAEE